MLYSSTRGDSLAVEPTDAYIGHIELESILPHARLSLSFET
jgi:hypothetical protein